MKKAMFLLADHGIDGREPEVIRFASFDEKERDEHFEKSPNKPWLTKVDRVVDLDKVANEVWKNLDGLEQVAIVNRIVRENVGKFSVR